MMMPTPLRHALPTLLVLLTIAACLPSGAQNIPAPTANMLPTPDDIKNAPALPFTDGTTPNNYNCRLPVEVEVKDVSSGGDRVVDIVAGQTSPPGHLTSPPASYRQRELMIMEYALAPPRFDRRSVVFHRSLKIALYRYENASQVTALFAAMRREDQSKGRLGTTLSIGDDAYVGKWNTTGVGDVYLYAQQGPFYIQIRSHGVATPWQEKLKDVMTYTAEIILMKLPTTGGATPPPVTPPPATQPATLEIIAGPEGIPNPVTPGGTVQCSVEARHSRDATLSYQWTATGGSFNNPAIRTPIWTAPVGGGATQFGITVKITAADGAQIGASFLEEIRGAPSRSIRIFIDGKFMLTLTPPTEINGSALVAMADIFRELGASVVWDGPQKKITATRGSRVIELWIGNTTALVDGAAVSLSVPPMVLGRGTTYVPVRFVAQALGAGVVFDRINRAVMITTASMPPIVGTPATPPQSTKLTVTSPTDGASVPERFSISGTGVPWQSVSVTVIAEATLNATGQDATSALFEGAQAMVDADGKWYITVDAHSVNSDQRVALKRLKITLTMPAGGNTVERVDLIVTLQGASGSGPAGVGNRPPTAPVVSIGPANPTAANGLFCKAEGSVDPDGDVVTYRYQWDRNGTLMADRIYAGLAATWTKAGQTWRCVVTPTDGNADGPSAEATVVIAP